MLRCIAIDDEPIALTIISRYCEQRGGIDLETFTSPRLAMQRIQAMRPDIVFLDIELNGVSGVELARQMPPSCCLIFTTAYAQYALDGFEVSAVDFLHKPYFYERFERAMQRAEQWLRMHDLLRTAEAASRQILLKSDYRTVSVSADTILYVESIDNYIKLHFADGTTLLSKMPLRTMEQQLPPGEFIRIHRSYIVARARITSFSRTEVILSRATIKLPIGKTYSDAVVTTLGGRQEQGHGGSETENLEH